MKPSDIQAAPCHCGECRQAGVTDLALRRDPMSGRWLHGYDLRRWYTAKAEFIRKARAAIGAPGRHANGFERLVNRDPGEEG
jgi:hypothetical protein